MSYEKFDFEEDPFSIRDPMVIPENKIIWNREDLDEGKKQLDRFIDYVINGRRIGMKIFGPAGSGKTWLLRYIQKIIKERLKEKALTIYIQISRMDPSFSVFYEKFIKQIKEHLKLILEKIYKEAGKTKKEWIEYLKDRDIATILFNIHSDEKTEISEEWLSGKKLISSDLKNLGVFSSLEGDYKKYETFKYLIVKSLLSFLTFTLMVDEIGHLGSAAIARILGDSMRELIDSFYDRFSLICTYTARAADEMIDMGYNEFLYRRLEIEIKLDPLKSESAPSFFRLHNECYRKKGSKIKDQLHPFTKDGVKALIELMTPDKRYPGFIFTNCGYLVEEAVKESAIIDTKFINTHKKELKDVTTLS